MHFIAVIILTLYNFNLSESTYCNCNGPDVRTKKVELRLENYGEAVCGKYYDGCLRWFKNIETVHKTNGYQDCNEWETVIARYACCRKGWHQVTKCVRSEGSQCDSISDIKTEIYVNKVCGASNEGRCYTFFKSGSHLESTAGFNNCHALDRFLADLYCCPVGPISKPY